VNPNEEPYIDTRLFRPTDFDCNTTTTANLNGYNTNGYMDDEWFNSIINENVKITVTANLNGKLKMFNKVITKQLLEDSDYNMDIVINVIKKGLEKSIKECFRL
jgi:hypothetical protein